jgi:hypothetical protein
MLRHEISFESFEPISGHVYYFPLCECTAGGISSKHKELLIVPEGYEPPDGVFRSCAGRMFDKEQVVELKCLRYGTDREYYSCKPYKEERWCMAGGNYLHSCDSRFPTDYPVPIHDRIEESY